jgi:hypothetical protein
MKLSEFLKELSRHPYYVQVGFAAAIKKAKELEKLETALETAQGLVKEAMWLLHIAEGYAESEIDDWEERAKSALKEATQ